MSVNCNDMSRYMKTGPLLKSSWLLASDCVSVLVSTTKSSVRGLFAYGRMGRLHNVLYDMDCMKLYSDLYGIYPSCTLNGTVLYPFKSGYDVRSAESYDISNGGRAEFSETENAVIIRDIPMYAEKTTESAAVMPELTIAVEENRVKITAVFPENAEECRIHLPWYPLYDVYTASGQKKMIQYYRHGYYTCNGVTDEIVGGLLLEDQLSRQASLRIASSSGVLRLHGCTVPEMNNAMYLSTDAVAASGTLEVTVEVIPAEIAAAGTFYYPCGSEAEIMRIQNGQQTIQTFRVPETRGVQTLMLDDAHAFLYCAVPDDRTMMKKAADAILKTMWKDGALEGVPPYAFDPVLLQPTLRSNLHYCSHGMRTMSSLCAQGVHSGDISYVDAAAHAIHQLVKVSHRFPNGAIFTPLQMDMAGNAAEYAGSSRPSDTGILLRGLVHIIKGYLHFEENEKARACAETARDYAKTLCMMQNEDGSFYDRYMYPTLAPSLRNKGTVNNWCLQLWKLIPLFRYFGMTEEAEQLDGLIRRYIAYQTEKENNIFYVSGGGEDASDFGDALNTDSTLFAMKYCLTGDLIWKTYAEQALMKSWLMSCMWADMPQYYSLHGNSDLGTFYDQPMGMFSAGGMHDLTAVEANLFAAEVLDSAFAADMAESLHNARLGSFIRDNGGMYMVVMQCPNYFHRDERHSENLMYGGVGVYDWYQAEKNSLRLQTILNKNV